MPRAKTPYPEGWTPDILQLAVIISDEALAARIILRAANGEEEVDEGAFEEPRREKA